MKWGKVGNFGELIGMVGKIGEVCHDVKLCTEVFHYSLRCL